MNIPLFDAHCDTISALLDEGGNLYENNYHLDLRRMAKFAPSAQFFAVWGGHYYEKAALLKSELSRFSDCAILCRKVHDAREAAREGKLAVFLSVEGAEQIDCSTELLRKAHEEDGVLMLNLCWNDDNVLCGAAMDSGGGLTEKGRRFVRAAQDMGVVIDLSHASERTFWDTIDITSCPVVTSHSNSKNICHHARNLTDEQFLALIQIGGGAGLNLCPHFLGESPDLNTCVAHIEHFLALGGEKAVFMGADLDGVETLPSGISGIQDMDKIFDALLRRNFCESLVRDIFYNNLMHILERAI